MGKVYVLKHSIRNSILTLAVMLILIGGLAIVETISQIAFPGLVGYCITLGTLLGLIPLVLLKPGVAKPILNWSNYLKKPRNPLYWGRKTGLWFVVFPLFILLSMIFFSRTIIEYSWTSWMSWAYWIVFIFYFVALFILTDSFFKNEKIHLFLVKRIWDEEENQI